MKRYVVSFWSVLVGLVPLAIVGCAARSTTVISSQTEGSTRARIDRMVVFANFGHGLDDQMSQGFEAGWSNRLSACGVKSVIFRNEVQNLDVGADADSATQRFRPTAILWIDFETGFVDASAGERKLNFNLKMIDAKSRKPVWRASTQFAVNGAASVEDRENFGVGFATTVVSKLRGDGVLSTCPPAGNAWPAVDVAGELQRRPTLDESKAVARPR
jgi:hypothetical protein